MQSHPLQQSVGFARTMRALGTHVTEYDSPRCVVQTRRFPLLGPVHLVSRGPLVEDGQDIATVLGRWQISGPLIVNAESPPARLPGFVKLARPKRIALLPLGPADTMRAALHQKWRNGLRRAERCGLATRVSRFDAEKHAWVTGAERTQQRNRGYRNWPTQFLNSFALQNPKDAKVFTTYKDGHPLAALVILCHPPWATYHLGITTPDGRACAAHAHGLWSAMNWLSKNAFMMLDLGQLTGPDGLDRFKLRTGAQVHRLGGTWLRLPRPLRRWRSFRPDGQIPFRKNA